MIGREINQIGCAPIMLKLAENFVFLGINVVH